MVLLVATIVAVQPSVTTPVIWKFSTTHNSKMTVSRGSAVMFDGLNVISPSAPPTMILCVVPSTDTGVAAGEPGYDEYVVTHDEPCTVIVFVTTDSIGAAGIVTPPYAAVVQEPERVEVVVAEALADDLNAAPSASALLR